MKPFYIIGLAAILALSAAFLLRSPALRLLHHAPGPALPSTDWHMVDRSADGFTVEMPAQVSQLQVPAYNQAGSAQPVNFIQAQPGADTTFSVAWADNPPVASSAQSPSQLLETALEGALTRTQTAVTSTTPASQQGVPQLDFSAANASGGLISSRLIYAPPRLYMLVAAFPSAGARQDGDVARFFNSFKLLPHP